jgi:hypothetical protein
MTLAVALIGAGGIGFDTAEFLLREGGSSSLDADQFFNADDILYLKDKIKNNNWLWHAPWQGMSDFISKSKYSELDLGLVQPIPLVAFDFIKNYIMPTVNLPWRSNREIDAVESMLYRKYQEATKKQNL